MARRSGWLFATKSPTTWSIRSWTSWEKSSPTLNTQSWFRMWFQSTARLRAKQAPLRQSRTSLRSSATSCSHLSIVAAKLTKKRRYWRRMKAQSRSRSKHIWTAWAKCHRLRLTASRWSKVQLRRFKAPKSRQSTRQRMPEKPQISRGSDLAGRHLHLKRQLRDRALTRQETRSSWSNRQPWTWQHQRKLLNRTSKRRTQQQ